MNNDIILDISARIPLTAMTKRVCFTNHYAFCYEFTGPTSKYKIIFD